MCLGKGEPVPRKREGTVQTMKTQDPEGTGTVVCVEGRRGSCWLSLSSEGQFRATTGAGVVKGSREFKVSLGSGNWQVTY